MGLKIWSSLLATALVVAAVPGSCQVRPAGSRSGIPLVVGAGFSSYNIDWGHGRRESGGGVWADWTIRQVPHLLNGLGVEVEAHDISLNPPTGLPNFRYDTAGGGLIYHYPRPRNIHPYAKFAEQYGSFDFPGPSGYTHDTRTLMSIGGGADIHAWHSLWVRADYEYQIWQHLFGSPHALTPNGITVGPEWDFGTW